jgi:two-component system chemotaxis sensor kinase CheA
MMGKPTRDLFALLIDPFVPPAVRAEGADLARQQRHMVAFNHIGFVIVFGFGLLNLRQDNTLAGLVEVLSAATMLAMLLVNRRGYPTPAAHVSLFVTALTIFIGMCTGGGMEAAAIVFLPMLPAIGLLCIGRSGGWAGVAEGVLIVGAVAILELMDVPLRHDSADKLFIKRVAEAVVVVVQIYVVCNVFFRLRNEAETQLSHKHDEMARLFHSLRQGVVAFGPDGRVAGRCSRQAEEIFKCDELEGKEVSALLFGDRPVYDMDKEHLATWLEMAFAPGRTFDELEELVRMAPDRCVLGAGAKGEQHLRLEFTPLWEGGELARVMMLVTDETTQVQLKREADVERAAHEDARVRMRRLAASGAHTFLDFLRSADDRLKTLAATFPAGGRSVQLAEIEVAFRTAHTIKGEARIYDLDQLSALMHDAEEHLHALRERALPGGSAPECERWTELRRQSTSAREAVDQARRDLVAASPVGDAILDQVTVRRRDLTVLRDWVASVRGAIGELIAPALEVVSRLNARPFGEAATGLEDGVQRWSAQQNKKAVLEIVGKEEAIGPELFEVLSGVLAHLTRNAVAHGIEHFGDRLRIGKPEVGHIRIACTHLHGAYEILVEDDGAGVNITALIERARELGVRVDVTDPLELIFVDGLSTAETVDALSGRGVGMSAVRSALAGVGYSVKVESQSGKGTRFALSPLRAAPALRQPA